MTFRYCYCTKKVLPDSLLHLTFLEEDAFLRSQVTPWYITCKDQSMATTLESFELKKHLEIDLIENKIRRAFGSTACQIFPPSSSIHVHGFMSSVNVDTSFDGLQSDALPLLFGRSFIKSFIHETFSGVYDALLLLLVNADTSLDGLRSGPMPLLFGKSFIKSFIHETFSESMTLRYCYCY